jgi:hypothetical protein
MGSGWHLRIPKKGGASSLIQAESLMMAKALKDRGFSETVLQQPIGPLDPDAVSELGGHIAKMLEDQVMNRLGWRQFRDHDGDAADFFTLMQ